MQLENIPSPLENWPSHSSTPYKDHTSGPAASANATVVDFLIVQLLDYSCSCQISRDIPEDSTSLSQIPCVVESHLGHLGVLESEDMLKEVNINILPEAWQQIFKGKVVPEQESMREEDTINTDNSADNEGKENKSDEDISMNQNRPLKIGGNACLDDNSQVDGNNPIWISSDESEHEKCNGDGNTPIWIISDSSDQEDSEKEESKQGDSEEETSARKEFRSDENDGNESFEESKAEAPPLYHSASKWENPADVEAATLTRLDIDSFLVISNTLAFLKLGSKVSKFLIITIYA